MLEQVAAFLERNAKAGRKLIPIAVNASVLLAKDLRNAETYSKILADHHINAALLEIELTETAAVSEFDCVKRLFACFQEKNMQTSLDDFGAGLLPPELCRGHPHQHREARPQLPHPLHHEPAGALLPPGDREHGQGPGLPSHLRGHRDQRPSGPHALPGLRRRPRLLVLQGHFDRGVRAKIYDRLTKQQRNPPRRSPSNQDTGSAGFCTTFSLSYFGRIDRCCRIR